MRVSITCPNFRPCVSRDRWFGEVNPVNQFPRAGLEKMTERERERESGGVVVSLINRAFFPGFIPGFASFHRFAISRLKPFLFAALVIRVSRSGPLSPSLSPSPSLCYFALSEKESEKKESVVPSVETSGGGECGGPKERERERSRRLF